MDNAKQIRLELSSRVKQVLKGAGVSKEAFAKTLCRVLGLGEAQAYRKLRAEADYTLPQIAAIENEFQVQILEFADDNSCTTTRDFLAWIAADLAIGGKNFSCRIVVGKALRHPPRRVFAAFLLRGKWSVCLPEECMTNVPLFEIDHLELDVRLTQTLKRDEPADGSI
jgi:hypothetical protein